MESNLSFNDKTALNKPLIGVAIAVLLIAIAAGYYWHSQRAAVPAVPLVAEPVAPAPPAEDVIEHPVPASPSVAEAPLPALTDSDTALSTALNDAANGPALTHYLVPENIIRHLVVTIDNLPRPKVAVEKRPTVPIDGVPLVDGDELHSTLDADNFKRYTPLVDALRQADMQRIAAVYFHFYPLFQKAYQDLGYPTGYFNDRLVKVIDSLLATPQPTGPIELVRPNVMYQFADPNLESRPAGQKLLLRMGPDNAAVVKAKLTELRAIITATPPKR